MEAPEDVVREFWRLMATNDFASVKAVLAQDFVLEWPQSNERIRGSENFAKVNAEYPASGPWRFTIDQLVAGKDEVVTRVRVTDGAQQAQALSFFTVLDGKVRRIVEYWPEPYQPATERRHLTEPFREPDPDARAFERTTPRRVTLASRFRYPRHGSSRRVKTTTVVLFVAALVLVVVAVDLLLFRNHF